MNETVKRMLRAVHNALVRGVRERRGSAYMSAVRAEMDTLMGEVSPEKVGPVSPEKPEAQASRAQLRYCRETGAWGLDVDGDPVYWHDGSAYVPNPDGTWTPVALKLGALSPAKVSPEKLARGGDGQ